MELSNEQLTKYAAAHGTPLYVYDTAAIGRQVERIMALSLPHGLTVRYAMKANPHPDIVRYLYKAGVQIDASSSYEVDAALRLGVSPDNILLTSQQSAHNLAELVRRGVRYNATSLRQLELYGQAAPGTNVGIRVNPGRGSGHSRKTNVGGPTSSFGIWHEYLAEALAIAQTYNLTVQRVHTHIGSGSDPNVWERAIHDTLAIVRQVDSATVVNLGGGFKSARVPAEQETSIETVGGIISKNIEAFQAATGRELQVELEPGTFFVANAGVLLARIDDVTDTGEQGYRFVKLDTGMNDILRPTLYGAQHPIEIIHEAPADDETGDYVVVGHNCESGDVLSVAAHDPEEVKPCSLRGARIGALVAIGGTGAYCASMSAHGYNSFPSAGEICV